LSYTPAKGGRDNKKSFPQRQVLVWIFMSCRSWQLENPGSRRQGGGGGEPR